MAASRFPTQNAGTSFVSASIAQKVHTLPSEGSSSDAFDAFSSKKARDLEEKDLQDHIRRFPKMADRLRADDRQRRKESRDLAKKYETELFPAGQVLAPGVAFGTRAGGGNFRVRDNNGENASVIFVFGKITYHDIFSGTKPHTTKFCMIWRGGNSFTICPTGNDMD